MSKIYEVETEKIKVKYEKLIGLIDISPILSYSTDIYQNLDNITLFNYEYVKLSVYNIKDVFNDYYNTQSLTYFNTSNILKFKNIELHLVKYEGWKIAETKIITVGLVIFKDQRFTLVKELAPEIKYLWEEEN